MLMLIHCLVLLPLWGLCICSLFCYAILCALSSFAIIRAGCFTFFVLLMSYDYYCSVVYIYVLIHIRNKGEFDTVKHV